MSADPQVSETNPNPSKAPAFGKSNKKKTNKQRLDARASFDPTAGPMSPEKFFSSFTEVKRSNVDVVLDLDIQERLADPYLSQAQDFSDSTLQYPISDQRLAISTFGLVSTTLIRKMAMAIPQSEQIEVRSLSRLFETELRAPKALIAAIDNIGKFETDDFIGRIKYHSLDMFRMCLKLLGAFSKHPDFKGRIVLPPNPGNRQKKATWADVDVTSYVNNSTSSALWIRDQAAQFLDRAYKTEWMITDEKVDAQYLVTYPRLEISANLEQQDENVATWLGKLNPRMPKVNDVIAAGICTCWRKEWFLDHSFAVLRPEWPDWIDGTPSSVLLRMNVVQLDIVAKYGDMLSDIYTHVQMKAPVFAQFLDLAIQPENKFGSTAMLMMMTEGQFTNKFSNFTPEVPVKRVKKGAFAKCFLKLKDKGAATAGIIFGFSRLVEVSQNYIGQVNGDPDNLMQQYLKSDFKRFSH